ncbi:MAG: lipocalin family protein, partial [Pseudomonadota bacterium]|nr:lipocalin family protein [Pseudomonadota bacterium]
MSTATDAGTDSAALAARLAATLPGRDDPDLDLDTRIALAEQRVVARDLALRFELRSLQSRARVAFKPSNLFHNAGKAMGLGGGAVVAAGALLWLWRGRRPSLATGSSAAQGGERDEPIGSASLFSLASLVGLGWPLMPERVREWLSPGAARMLVSMGAPLLARLFGSRAAPPLVTMTSVDPTRFAGNWYAVAHLPLRLSDACEGLGTVRYAMKRPGEYKVTVRCPAPADRSGGRVRALRGVARLVSGSGG